MYKRLLSITLPPKQSAFLWGARKTGKSTFLKEHFPQSVYYDLLKSEKFIRYSQAPHLFREEILSLTPEALQHPVIVDEIQKIPMLLDEIHWLIENSNAQFILCGSSARKLKRQGVNLLGGRAWGYHFYPLVYPEISDFDLLKILNIGAIPSHYLSVNPHKSVRAYINDYLVQEIQREGLVRHLPAFAKFLESVVFSNCELVNYTNIARECGIDAKTVKEYYQILIDTLIGYYVEPYTANAKRALITATPKFYLFDVGIATFLAKKTIESLRGAEAGKALENYILQEIIAYRELQDVDFKISYWRTQNGLEVDFVLGRAEVAIEVKISENPRSTELKGIVEFTKEYSPKKSYIVCNTPMARKTEIGGVEVLMLPIEGFLKKLWKGEVI